MRAIVLDNGNGPKLVTNHPPPAVDEGEALVRPIKVGVSPIDVEVCRGLSRHNGVLGHQFVGVVESVDGGDADGLVGQRVVGAPALVCGDCDMCRRGLPDHCRTLRCLGRDGRDGCLAEAVAVPSSNLLTIESSLQTDEALFAPALASAVQASRQLHLEGKPYITVLGDGPLALLTVQIMARRNASVRLIGRRPDHLALCERWSIKHRHMDDIGRRGDQDVVVDCTGEAEGLNLALDLVRPRGKVLLKSQLAPRSQTDAPDLATLVRKEVELIGSGPGPLSEALAMLQRGEVDVVSLLGRRFRLDDGPASLNAAAEPGALQVVVEI